MSVGVIAIDRDADQGERVDRSNQNRSYREVVNQILREAEETDRREDELYGDARGDELPEQLRTPEGRRAALEEAKRRIEERKGRAVDEEETVAEEVVDPELVLGRGGRRGGRRESASGCAPRTRSTPGSARRGRSRATWKIACSRRSVVLEENHRVDLAANDAYERWRATERDTLGRVLRGNSKPFVPPELPDGTINLSDPDSRVMRTKGMPPRQAYNAQAAVNERHIILAAEVTVDAADFGASGAGPQRHPRAPAATRRDRAAGRGRR